MKRIISLTLALLMLAAMLFSVTACEFGMESRTGFTQLRDYVMTKDGDQDKNGLSSISVHLDEADNNVVFVSIGGENPKEYLYLGLTLTGSTEKALLVYKVVRKEPKETVCEGVADIILTHYTGDDLVSFSDTSNLFTYEFDHREYATTLLNRLLIDLDVYMHQHLDLSVRDLGFVALSEKYMADTEDIVAEENLGGAFSAARLKRAGLMLLQGLGMVFLVLIILWIVLLIFKVVFAKDSVKSEKEAKRAAKESAKAEKTAPAPVSAPEMTPAAAPAPTAPVADDGQLIAVITAAVAATIESDPALSSRFASGFRVVSFQKTDKSRNR